MSEAWPTPLAGPELAGYLASYGTDWIDSPGLAAPVGSALGDRDEGWVILDAGPDRPGPGIIYRPRCDAPVGPEGICRNPSCDCPHEGEPCGAHTNPCFDRMGRPMGCRVRQDPAAATPDNPEGYFWRCEAEPGRFGDAAGPPRPGGDRSGVAHYGRDADGMPMWETGLPGCADGLRTGEDGFCEWDPAQQAGEPEPPPAPEAERERPPCPPGQVLHPVDPGRADTPYFCGPAGPRPGAEPPRVGCSDDPSLPPHLVPVVLAAELAVQGLGWNAAAVNARLHPHMDDIGNLSLAGDCAAVVAVIDNALGRRGVPGPDVPCVVPAGRENADDLQEGIAAAAAFVAGTGPYPQGTGRQFEPVVRAIGEAALAGDCEEAMLILACVFARGESGPEPRGMADLRACMPAGWIPPEAEPIPGVRPPIAPDAEPIPVGPLPVPPDAEPGDEAGPPDGVGPGPPAPRPQEPKTKGFPWWVALAAAGLYAASQ